MKKETFGGQNRSKVILVNGQIIKISKDKNNIEKKEVLTKSWEDWIADEDFETQNTDKIEESNYSKAMKFSLLERIDYQCS